MTKPFHVTNNINQNAPSSADLSVGEILVNCTSLGAVSNGVNSGRLYIKMNDNSVRRFISIGLPSSTDPAFKTAYGGTNNTFSTATSPTETTSDSLMVFKYSSAGNHQIDKTPNDKLTWNTANNRLNINRTSPASSTLHVGGDIAADTMDVWSGSVFNNSTLRLVGWSVANNTLYGIPSANLLSYLPAASLPVEAISGNVPINKGGTGADLTSTSPTDGAVLFYDTSGPAFSTNNTILIDDPNNKLQVNGIIEYDAPLDTTNVINALALDATNRIVKLGTAGITPATLGGTGSNLSSSDDGSIMYYSTAATGFLTESDLRWTSSTNTLTVNNGFIVLDNGMLDIQANSSDPCIRIDSYTSQSLAIEVLDGLIAYSPPTGVSIGTLCINASGRVVLDQTSVSSQKFKENIHSYSKGLNVVCSLDPVSYTYKNDDTHKVYAGLIAETLTDKNLEEYIIRDGSGDILGIQYNHMVALLINAVKELKQEIDQLKNQ